MIKIVKNHAYSYNKEELDEISKIAVRAYNKYIKIFPEKDETTWELDVSYCDWAGNKIYDVNVVHENEFTHGCNVLINTVAHSGRKFRNFYNIGDNIFSFAYDSDIHIYLATIDRCAFSGNNENIAYYFVLRKVEE